MTAPTETERRVYIADAPAELDDGTSDPGDVAHYVDQRIDQDVTEAYVMGTELIALCGYRWIPTKSPEKLPVCRPCVEVLKRIAGGA